MEQTVLDKAQLKKLLRQTRRPRLHMRRKPPTTPRLGRLARLRRLEAKLLNILFPQVSTPFAVAT